MNVLLRLTLDCEPDVAWRAIANPDVFRQVSSPLMKVTSKEPGGFPETWSADGPHEVSLKLLGLIPLGRQTIDISFTQRPGGVRMMVDSGKPLSGPLGMVKTWDHRMAISETGNQQTLYRDRLVVKAGLLTPVIFMGMWIFWQIRGAKLKRLAPSWK
jgi:hypothetical protein